MRLRFLSLGSGSRGNATLVQSATTLLLIDCGFAPRELERRCRQAGVDPADIDAALLTHEHGDHCRGASAVARSWQIPVWMTHGTARGGRLRPHPQGRIFDAHCGGFEIGDIHVRPFAVPHDAREPCQYRFETAGVSMAILTDCGSITPSMSQALDGVDALLLECNHDLDMLAAGPYPPSLKRRVGGRYGHLNNAQSAALLAKIDHRRLEHLALGHLSEKNNRPELAIAAIAGVDATIGERLRVLEQDQVSPWMAL